MWIAAGHESRYIAAMSKAGHVIYDKLTVTVTHSVTVHRTGIGFQV